MAGSVNKVIIIGNLGKDPEVRTMQSGDKVANLSVATSESWKDKTTGEKKERTEWHRVTIWNPGIVRIAETYLQKGAKVFIEGQLETRKWTDDKGIERYSTEVVLRPYRGTLTMLSSRGGGAAGSDDDDDHGGYPQPQDMATNSTGRNTQTHEMEEEIPF